MSAIETFSRTLPNGTRLSCRAAGEPGRPLMLFVHGFPEAAFVWDTLMAHFAQPANGGYRCLAPNLRGFEQSSAPPAVDDYKPALLLQDLHQLVQSERPDGKIDTLVGHDWGGALTWAMANAWPQQIGRLVSINSPHAATFARELANNPEQQAASAYMHYLAAPGAEAKLAENDFARLFTMLGTAANASAADHATASSGWASTDSHWLTDDVKAQYRAVWSQGLTGACNLYRVTPMKPPLPGQAADVPQVPAERARVDVPTLVIWGLDDKALRPGLLEGLDQHVPDLRIERVAGASHWIVHEMPERVAQLIRAFQQA